MATRGCVLEVQWLNVSEGFGDSWRDVSDYGWVGITFRFEYAFGHDCRSGLRAGEEVPCTIVDQRFKLLVDGFLRFSRVFAH